MQAQIHYLKEAIRHRYGLGYSLDWSDRLRAIDHQQISLSAEQLRSLAERLRAIEDHQPVSKQEFISLSKTIESIRREVEET